MCLSEFLERTPLCNSSSWGITDEDLSLLQSTAMGGKGEAWKVLSLTHVEYKVGWRLTGLSILTRSVDHREFLLHKVDTERMIKHYFELLAMSQEDDPMGKMFAIYSLLPLVIVIVFATTFFIRCYPQHKSQLSLIHEIRRDLHTLTYAIGVIVNYIGNYSLKQVRSSGHA